MRHVGLISALTLALAAGTAAAQAPACAASTVSSRDALAAALDSLAGPAGAEFRAASLAAQGPALAGWASAIAGDSAPGNPPARRAAALRVLRFARWRPAIPTLVRLADPLRGDWVVWFGALNALTWYPYAELEPFWIDLLTFPRRVVREQALHGIALVGTPQVLPGVRNSTHKDTDDAMRALVADVEAKLRMPMEERVRLLDSASAAICRRAP